MIKFTTVPTGHEVIIIDVHSIKAIAETTISTDGTGKQTTCTAIWGFNYYFQVDGSLEETRETIVFEIDRRNKAAL